MARVVFGEMVNLEQPGRHSIRLRGYDYTSSGAYFITVCTRSRLCLFGDISNEVMHLNEAGQIISDEWSRTARVRRNVSLDAFAVMPNHIHVIIFLNGIENTVGANRRLAPTTGMPLPPQAGSIGAIMAQFKSITTKRINAMRGMKRASVWQRNYYEHVIRSETELDQIREYIVNNPESWTEDSENPEKTSSQGRTAGSSPVR